MMVESTWSRCFLYFKNEMAIIGFDRSETRPWTSRERFIKLGLVINLKSFRSLIDKNRRVWPVKSHKAMQGFSGRQRPRRPGSLKPSFPSFANVLVFSHDVRGWRAIFLDTMLDSKDRNKVKSARFYQDRWFEKCCAIINLNILFTIKSAL